jgi:VanZ family protein
VRYWLPVVAYSLLIFALSSMSRPPIPSGVSGDLLHYPEFAVLAFLLARAFHGARPGAPLPKHVLWAMALTVAFGATDEFHQAFVPDRVPDVMDWLHDGIGAAAGLLLWGIWRWIRR